jgi:hypothetical protein
MKRKPKNQSAQFNARKALEFDQGAQNMPSVEGDIPPGSPVND